MPIRTGYCPLTLTYNLDFQSQVSYGRDPHTGPVVEKIEWKQTDEQTDRLTDAIYCFTFQANVVDKDESTGIVLIGPLALHPRSYGARSLKNSCI